MLVDITDRHRHEAEVHAQQERFRALIEASAQIVWTTDRNGLAVEDSPSWRAFTGQSYERLKGAGWLDAIHPDDRERVFASWSNAVHSKTNFKVEYRMRHASGDWRWTLARAAPVFARDGTVAEWVGMNIDITERKAAEQALQVQKWRFETLNRIAKLVSSELDVDRIVQTVTDVATELSGAKFGAFFYSGAGDRGESHVLYALSGARREAFASLGTPRNTALFEPTFRGTSVIRADDIRTDRRFGQNHPHYGMPKGHLPVVSYLAIPVGRLGKVHGALLLGHPQPGVFTEETEEIVTGVAAHAAIAIDNASLYQVERRLASIVETSADAIVSKSLDGIVTSWNLGAERLFGYTAGEMIGKSITIVIPADRHTEEADILERIRRGERVEHYETVRMRKDGSLVDISLSVSPVKDADGRITGASKIARDITERKQAQARQELLTREIHHRTKNLFAVVHAVVARSFADKRTVKEAEAAVLSRLHSFAQTHVLLIEKEWQGADIAEVVRTEMEPYAGRVSIEGETVLLNAQAAQNFALALHELATNAAKYGALSNQSGRVFISWRVFKPNGHRRFTFRWEERGGPPVAPPLYRGFGSAVLERVMAEYFDTPPQIEFARNGVCYELSGSLEAITGQA
jgi:PAS domain S-box-containing protein